ncbi:MAG TPA: DUF1003 domain-containing protein [Vicinamibacterales bacterium]|nr:DUF1003 domain-containing protein [Vicinamibacterales bacterium]
MSDKAAAVPEPAARNIEAIASLEREALHDQSRLDRFTGAVTAAAGSPLFLVAHAIWFAGWIVFNVTRAQPPDPYPFGLLMLIVSLEAIFLSAAVLMTQNRMQRQADKRAHLDLQVNLLAEQELTTMLKMLRGLCHRLDVPIGTHDGQVEQLLEDTDIQTLATALDREMPDATTAPSSPAPSSAPEPRTPSPRRS